MTLRILGIDPGYAIVGYGILDYDGAEFVPVSYGAITTQAGEKIAVRLEIIYHDMHELIRKFHPDCIAIERLYSTSNQKTVVDVSQARGVIVLVAQQEKIPLREYTPLQVKQSVVGYGKAEKLQMMDMTRRILRLSKVPRPDDAADALAIAICHGHSITGIQLETRTIRETDTI